MLLGEAIGGKLIDLEWTQVHPTGPVKPGNPDAEDQVSVERVLAVHTPLRLEFCERSARSGLHVDWKVGPSKLARWRFYSTSTQRNEASFNVRNQMFSATSVHLA